MASDYSKRRARRKLASAAFLTRISLDGDKQDYHQGTILNCDHTQVDSRRRLLKKRADQKENHDVELFNLYNYGEYRPSICLTDNTSFHSKF